MRKYAATVLMGTFDQGRGGQSERWRRIEQDKRKGNSKGL